MLQFCARIHFGENCMDAKFYLQSWVVSLEVNSDLFAPTNLVSACAECSCLTLHAKDGTSQASFSILWDYIMIWCDLTNEALVICFCAGQQCLHSLIVSIRFVWGGGGESQSRLVQHDWYCKAWIWPCYIELYSTCPNKTGEWRSGSESGGSPSRLILLGLGPQRFHIKVWYRFDFCL